MNRNGRDGIRNLKFEDYYEADYTLLNNCLYGEHRDEDLHNMSYNELEQIWIDELGYDENDESIF